MTSCVCLAALRASAQLSAEELEAPRPLPWYPDNLAWQMSFSRAQLRKLPILEAIHEFIKRENEAGSITRQEAVSMVPPLFLDVQPHHKVGCHRNQ
jgi:16S rRNA C967 or C1407 C5-methylase (RsmB/RsmF family)